MTYSFGFVLGLIVWLVSAINVIVGGSPVWFTPLWVSWGVVLICGSMVGGEKTLFQVIKGRILKDD